jgi:hypothetical protein
VDGRDGCFGLVGQKAITWQYPALQTSSTLPMTGIAECDAYGVAVTALASCEQIPQATRDAMVEAYKQAAAAWATLPPESHAAVKEACKAATDAVAQASATCS